MKLYDCAKAPNPRRVRWVMAEKDINDIEIVQVDLFKGEHKTPEYLAKAGMPNVPALEIDDDTTITESVAICRYLESLYPQPNLLGKDAREIAIIEMWTRRMEMMLATPLMLAIRHTHPALAALDPQDPTVRAHNTEAATRGLKFLDRRLEKEQFIACNRLTIVDIIVHTSIDFGRIIKFAPPPELENLARWSKMMAERPAAAAGM
jgi:glutathione S-transferase